MKRIILPFLCICIIILFSSCSKEMSSQKGDIDLQQTNQTDPTIPDEIAQILNRRGDKSNAEVNEELQTLTDAKKQDCEQIKNDILNRLTENYSDNAFLVEHMNLEEILQGFLSYYDSALHHIEERKNFNETTLIPFVFNGGTASGESLIIHEYYCYDSLYLELQKILSEIQ